jgi:hypothetical protein
LTAEAQEVRGDAKRLRQETEDLKLRVRGNLALSRERLGSARLQADRAWANRVESRPSPWSELQWTQTYEALEQTLVPVS